MKKQKTKKIEVTESSGNVFADLGFKNPEEMMAKANLAILIGDTIKKRKLIPNIRNNVGFGKEAAQIFCLERVTIASMARHE